MAILQVSRIIQIYLQYPSIVSPTFEKDSVIFPAVTICPEHWCDCL